VGLDQTAALTEEAPPEGEAEEESLDFGMI